MQRSFGSRSTFDSILSVLVWVLCVFESRAVLNGQTVTMVTPQDYSSVYKQTVVLTCPGGFPTDLTITNCDFKEKLRLQQWVTTSFTDQAMLGAVIYGTGAQIIKSPGEWGRTWGGYGDRIGVRYTQAAARGTAEFIVGSLLHDDPRHLSYKDDPHTPYGSKIVCSNDEIIGIVPYPIPKQIIWKRIGHAFVDSVSVLRSSSCGTGTRIPAFDRYVGIAAGAYGGYAWYPRAENTLPNAADRAAMSYGSTLLGSFYTEFSPELFKGLTSIFLHNKKPSQLPQPSNSVSAKE